MGTLRAIVSWFDARRRWIAVILVAWIALVVAGAGPSPRSSEWVGVPDARGALAAAFGLVVLFSLLFLIFLRPGQRAGTSTGRARGIRWMVAVTAAIVITSLIVEPADLDEEDPPPERESVTLPAPALDDVGRERRDAGDTGPDTGDVALLLAIGAGAAAAFLWSRRMTTVSAVEDDEEDLYQQLAPAVNDATDHLLHGSEPRAAVLAAYAALEQSLADRGHHRGHAETPSEHMARVLAAVPVLTAPAVRLGRLYELARFSDHPITVTDQQQAAAALDQAARELGMVASEAT